MYSHSGNGGGANITFSTQGGGHTFLRHKRGGDKHFPLTEGGPTFYTHRGDKHFYIPGEGNKHFLFEVAAAIMMWMVRRRRM